MIKTFHHKPGRYAPIIVCDVCGQRIENANLAAVITTLRDIPEEGQADIMHVHKGACHDTAERRLGGSVGWEEMSRHILHLAFNVGLSPKKLEAHYESDKEVGDFFRTPENDA